MMPDGTLTDRGCRVELLKRAKFLDENYPEEVKAHPNDLPSDIVIRLLQATTKCGSCGRELKYGPLCTSCQ